MQCKAIVALLAAACLVGPASAHSGHGGGLRFAQKAMAASAFSPMNVKLGVMYSTGSDVAPDLKVRDMSEILTP